MINMAYIRRTKLPHKTERDWRIDKDNASVNRKGVFAALLRGLLFWYAIALDKFQYNRNGNSRNGTGDDGGRKTSAQLHFAD